MSNQPPATQQVAELLDEFADCVRRTVRIDHAYDPSIEVYAKEADALREQIIRAVSSERKLTVEVPEGWQIVPKEPTPEMHAAANREWDGRMSARSAGVYQAMLAAAPRLVSVKEFTLSERDDTRADRAMSQALNEGDGSYKP